MGLHNRPSRSDSDSSSESLTDTAKAVSRQDGPARSRRILLVDADEKHANQLCAALLARGLNVEHFAAIQPAISRFAQPSVAFDVVIVNVSDSSQPWLRQLEMLHEAAYESAAPVGPLLLCVSNVKRDELFELDIERMGGRLVYER